MILNRCDLVSAEARDETVRWAEGEAPNGRVVPAERSAVPAELVLGLRGGAGERASSLLRTPGGVAASVLYESLELKLDGAVDVDRLARALTAPGSGVLRAKGFLRDKDDRLLVLQVVGRRSEITDAPAGATPGTLVAIGLKGRLDRAGVERAAYLSS